MMPDQDEPKQIYTEQNRKASYEPDSEKPPENEPRDAIVIVGAIVGLILGGSIGFFVSFGIGGVFIAILATGGGALLGGSVGALLGQRLREAKKRRDTSDDHAAG
jgi:uncharacterized protein YcfJ